MRFIGSIWYYLTKTSQADFEANKTLRQHVRVLRKNGYTKKVFDVDGHTVVIQSHGHVDDFSA